MGIIDIYSKRKKILLGKASDIFYYDNIPKSLKVQIVHIISDAIGKDKGIYNMTSGPFSIYQAIYTSLCREYGTFTLGKQNGTYEDSVLLHLVSSEDTDLTLDVIEICFKYISQIIGKNLEEYLFNTNVKMKPDEAITELNERFKEHSIGYQFESDRIIRIDSTYIHSEITKPTLSLLWNTKFSGANEEYLKAHEHYKHGRNKECLNECLKAFESVMKAICDKKNWSYNKTDTSKKLIQICFQNGLVPSFTQNQFTSLQNLLESGIPTIRNKLGGHGQGAVPQKVDDDITRYALNLTGTNIVFLIEQSGIT